MVFSSITFLMLFFTMVLILYFNPLAKSRKYKNMVLLLASLGFYTWGEPIFIFILMISVCVNYLLARLMDRQLREKRTIILFIAVIFNLTVLFLFKYLGFTLSNLGYLLNKDWNANIALPIGISFYTFQIISFIADLYRKKVKVQKNLLHLCLYITMFPQLIAGPIVRYETIADEIENRKETWSDFTDGMFRFVIGLSKKVLIANNVALLADKAFALTEMSVATAWLGAIAYTLQIYFDFSGYSDMAIGMGRIFGFHFNENFNYPYVAHSVTDFWRRWHISLSTWFRDYVYIPLGGNRVSVGRHIFNLFVVWFLTGLWHGANWTFILWGLIYFLVQFIEKFLVKFHIPKWIGHIYTMITVICCWVLFRADTITSAFSYLGNMLGVSATGLIDDVSIGYLTNYKVFLIIGLVACLPIKNWLSKNHICENKGVQILQSFYVLVLYLLCLSFVLASSYDPFIYFNF